MTPDEYKEAVAALGMSMKAFAEWLGAHGQTGRRWAAGGPPSPVAKLLELMQALGYETGDVDKTIATRFERINKTPGLAVWRACHLEHRQVFDLPSDVVAAETAFNEMRDEACGRAATLAAG